MTRAFVAILALTTLISAGLWLSVRAARAGHLEALPAHSRRRMQWWQANATHIQLTCGFVVAAAACLEFTDSLS